MSGGIPKSFPWPAVYTGFDARKALPVAGGSVALTATSTPFWAKATYSDEPKEWGSGPLGDFIKDQIAFAKVVWDATRPGGWFALNLGDTRANTGGAGGDVARAGQRIYRQDRSHGIVGQQWCMVPEECALAIRTWTDWQLTGKVIWDKGRPVHTDNSLFHLARNRRPGLQHEFIYLFWKPGGDQTWNTAPLAEVNAKGDIWRVTPSTDRPPRAKRSDDVKPWPNQLASRLVRVLSNAGDVVLDPCAGYGTTARVANFLDRKGMAFDLYWGTEPWPMELTAEEVA